MADIKVKDLTDTTSITLDNQVMVLTNDEQNQVQNITVENLLSNVLSSDNGNVLEQGTDGKLYVETPENITGELSDLSTTEKTTLVGAINEVDSDLATEVTNRTNAISAEAITRANADNNLQTQIDAITAASDVTDIVGTYAELQAYDTTGLPDNSIIKVLQDESRQDETTYYRWVITDGVGAWVLIGEEGPYYTKSQADNLFETQESVGNLNNLATSDKSSVVSAINELSSVLDPTQTADYIKNSKAIYSGEVSENALILPQIKEMAHSTFDLSKFTVVGTPTITSDGVASGFSSSNRIVAVLPNPITINSDFCMRYKVHTSSSTVGNVINTNIDNATSRRNFQLSIFGGRLDVYIGDGINSQNLYMGGIPSDADVYIKFEKKSGKYYLKTFDKYMTLISETETDVQYTPNLTSIAYIGGSDSSFNGSIDLKYFSITVDGVEVFSGNKTGIDVIKPDNYTVVGSPTITSDGVASGFSSSNRLTISNIPAFNKPFKVEFKIKTGDLSSGQSTFYSNGGTYYNAISAYGGTNPKLQVSLRLSDNSTPTFSAISGLQGNTDYTGFFEWTGAEYRLHVDGLNDTVLQSSLALSTADNTTVKLGCLYTNELPFNGSIDLNAFKIYVDGDLVYQPCLKIPYTESKTGSKIVQSIYRDRVNDMYEQFGYAPYYTLSDTDFTLPQGEVYGLIEKRARDIAHPVAVPFFRLTDEIYENEVRLEGAEVEKGLYKFIEENLAAYCTVGSTDDTICLPNFIDRVPWGANSQGYIEAGLPNITGNINGLLNSGSGVFQYLDHPDSDTPNAAWTNPGSNRFDFDASRSSSIYGNSSTVQPPAFKVRWLARWK